MVALQLFVTPAELHKIVQNFMERRNLTGIIRTRQDYQICNFAEASSELVSLNDMVNQMYLLPREEPFLAALSEETFQPRIMGAIKIDFGKLVKEDEADILLMTSFSTEDRQGLIFKPATWLRQLKKQLLGSGIFKFGVEGINTVYGGRNTYANIGYSILALNLFKEGVLWKQYPENNSEFHPLSHDIS